MVNRIKLKKGLDINLAGVAERTTEKLKTNGKIALMPSSFSGLVPKILIKEGEKVKAGTWLFVDKNNPEIGFASPASGCVSAIVRGERRKVLSITIDADLNIDYVDFGKKDPSKMAAEDVINSLLESGLFGYINQRPFDIIATPNDRPKAIFVSALRDMPLSSDFEYELEGQEKYFQAGLTALSKVAKTYLGVGYKQNNDALVNAKDVEVTIFEGPCPAGNVGVHINNIAPINKGEIVWTVEPTAVIFFGKLFCNGIVDLKRKVAIAGSQIKKPVYADVLVGTSLADLLKGRLKEGNNRIINGNPLTGIHVTNDETAYLGAHTSEVAVIPEGNDTDEFVGWIMPRLNQFSVSRSYFSWLLGKRKYSIDARVKGGERHMIMSGEYDKVIPMDILPEFLIKAIIANDIDKMEQLGIYEVAPEDFALAEFVCSSKLELQKIIREGIELMRNA